VPPICTCVGALVSDAGGQGDTGGQQNVLPVEPRYAREMPFVLIALALALAIYAGWAQQQTTVTSRTTVAQRPTPKAAKARAAKTKTAKGKAKAAKAKAAKAKAAKAKAAKAKAAKAKAAKAKLVKTKVTTTEKAPSDTLLGLLFGLAVASGLAGAFYPRVTKITLPGGGGFEMGAAAADLQKIAKEVPEQVRKELEKQPAVRDALTPEGIAELAAQATAQAQQEALMLRFAMTAPAPPTRVPVGTPELARARRGMPLSDDLVKRLTENAVRQALKQPDG
jgi:hypothetical protein